MAEVPVFAAGGYRYIRAVFQYSGGVAAEPGYEIERARFRRPLPLAEGLAAAEAHLRSIGRPTMAFAACELRSPAPFTEQGFFEFNKAYVGTLERWEIYKDGVNPVARTNVCPEYHKPGVSSLYAFSYTVQSKSKAGTFIVAGSGEAREGNKTYRETIVSPGDTSPAGMRAKVRYVIAEMEARLTALGFTWADTVSTQAYTVHDIGSLVGPEIAARGAAQGGLEWHYCRPPVIHLEFEMDVRGAVRELML